MLTREFLHDNIILRSDKQSSAQGSVFYVKQLTQNDGQEYVLKIALGPNLRNLQKQCPHRKFSKPTVYKLIVQIVSPTHFIQNTHYLISDFFRTIERLRQLHSLGYVHNDLKLENILVGHKDPDLVYLIDFGLTQTYNLENGNHSEKEYVRKFSGNFLFASLNSCRGNNKSRRDDIESVMYIMIYLLNENYLPWCDIEKKYEQGMEFKDVLRERLEIEYTKRLFSMIPKELIQTLKNILTLKFDQEPDYDEIIQAINKTKQNYIGQSPSVAVQFEWTVNIATKIKTLIHQENSKFEASECSLDKNILNFKSKMIASGDIYSVSPARFNNGVVYSSKMFVHEENDKFNKHLSRGALQFQMIPMQSSQEEQKTFSNAKDGHLNPAGLRGSSSPVMNHNITAAKLAFQTKSSSFKRPSQFSKGNLNLQIGNKQIQISNKHNSCLQNLQDESDADSMSECRDEDFETEEIDEIIQKHTFDVIQYSMDAQQMNIRLVGRRRQKSADYGRSRLANRYDYQFINQQALDIQNHNSFNYQNKNSRGAGNNNLSYQIQ
eukprot:403348809